MCRATTTERLREALGRPTDVAALVAFRVIFGVMVAISATRFFWYGWIDRFFIQPSFQFKYWGFARVTTWPLGGPRVHIALVGVLGLCVALGLLYRVTAPLLFVVFSHLQLMDASLYLNHYYLVSLLAFLLCWMPLGRAVSLDAWLFPSRRVSSFPAWCTHLLRFQIGLVYTYAGLAKLSTDWLVHAQPLNIWLHGRAEMPLIGGLFTSWWFALTLSWVGFLFDVSIAGWLSWRRSRPYGYAALVAFHTLTHLLFNIGMFPLIMTASALVFFPPGWPRRIFSARKFAPPPTHASSTKLPRVALAALGVYCGFQVLFPLRHLAYPGHVLWGEQGMRWSWKVKVREKNGAITYFVTLPSGRQNIVRPSRYLADYQEREMSGQPDLILQLAHHIQAEFDARGLGPVAVRAEAVVSLNGRPSAPMIDPTVDLTQITDGIGTAAWILPMPSTSPRHLGR